MPLYYFHSAVGLSPSDTVNFNLLVNERLKVTYYQLVTSTSGVVTPPTGGTLKLNQFGSGTDAVLSTVDAGNVPTFQTPLNSSGVPMGVAMDAAGNYVADPFLESTVALIYCYTIDLPHFDETKSILQVERDDYASEVLTYTNKTIHVDSNSIIGASNRIAQFNASTGLLEPSSITNTELGYLSGLSSALQTQIDGKQTSNSNLTTIAGLTATSNNFIVSVAGAWASRTPAQVKTTLAIANTDISGLGTLSTQNGTFSGTSSGTNTGDQNLSGYALIGQTMYIGTIAVAINRTSAALALTGITSIDGQAATVVTNANLTGIVTSIGNATSIAGNAITDGYIASAATWNAKGSFTLPSLTSGSVLYSNGTTIVQDNANFYFASHLLSVNVNADFTGTDSINIYKMIDSFTLNTSDNGYSASHSRGTAYVPTSSLANDYIGIYGFYPYTNAWVEGASMRAYGEGVSTTDIGTRIEFWTKINAGVLTKALVIDSTQSITTGIWKATLIDPTYGGTGVNNGAKTITLSGNFATTGAFNPTFAIPRSTTWTLPNTASETLAGLGTAQTFTTKQTFTAATTEIASLTILDTTYKVALDLGGAGILRIANGFTSVNITKPVSLNTSAITLGTNCDIAFSTSATSNIGQTTTQKFAFWGATAIVQPANTVAIDTLLANTGLRASGGVANFDLDVKVNVVGKGLYVKEGTNATMGVATLVLGVATVSTTKVTANSRIFLAVESLGTIASPVAIAVTARSAGTSFTITSANLTDTSVISWIIIEPA